MATYYSAIASVDGQNVYGNTIEGNMRKINEELSNLSLKYPGKLVCTDLFINGSGPYKSFFKDGKETNIKEIIGYEPSKKENDIEDIEQEEER